jgi:hypothetical protein
MISFVLVKVCLHITTSKRLPSTNIWHRILHQDLDASGPATIETIDKEKKTTKRQAQEKQTVVDHSL